MSSPSTITRRHLDRLAMIYVRQSTLTQVREHTESTARQYALTEAAQRFGWDPSRILTIDSDLGLSARTASGRVGFKELVSRVCLGEVGAIFGLEVSRLARSSADLQRLLEFCSLSDTLIVDADGIYDLQNFNDRLLLGLKGTMSEAELHILAGRLQESKRAAARRGALRFPLPVGYVFNDDGQTVMDPHEEIRAAVADVFSAFEATGSAYGVVGCFRDRPFPRRAYGGAWAGEIRWGRLTHSRVLGLLSNPAYAGAYVFGRYHSQRVIDPDGTIRTRTIARPRSEWAVTIQDHHPAYIRWETFLANEQRLAANNTQKGARPSREGPALLQGMIACGACARAMSVRYQSGQAIYDCATSRADHTNTPECRSVKAAMVDQAVAERVLAMVSPAEIAVALAAADEVEDRRARSNRALELRVERARYEAARAERAFHQCEPENRLVARSLEHRWEDKLKALAEAESALTEAQAVMIPMPPRAELEALASDLPRLWVASTTSDKDRKRLLRTLVADVTLRSAHSSEIVRVGIHWRSGAGEELLVRRPPGRRTPLGAIELVRQQRACRDEEIAKALAIAGFRTGSGRPFDVAAVRWLRHVYRIQVPSPLAPGEVTVADVAATLGITEGVVYYWIKHGQLDAVDKLTVKLQFGRYNFVVEADIQGFFDNLNHKDLVEMLSRRIGDRQLLRLIQKWLKAGVLETNGQVMHPATGTPQGGIVSPILANVYLHYTLDLWFHEVVKWHCRGEACLIRYADDFICAFENEDEAQHFYGALELRLEKFGLKLAAAKSRVIPFSRSGEPGATRFDFLGFEFSWRKDRAGKPHLKRRTSRKKLRNSLANFTQWCKQSRHVPLRELFPVLGLKLRGYYNYYGVSGNSNGLKEFFNEAMGTLWKWLNRRSQRRSFTRQGFNDLLDYFHVPRPRITIRRRPGLQRRFFFFRDA